MSKDNHQVYTEFGPGWNSLLAPIAQLANELDATITQAKEKYGELRIYFDPGQADTDALEEMIDRAEEESRRTCEMCGKLGHLMVKGIWYKTLCKEHATDLGYKEHV